MPRPSSETIRLLRVNINQMSAQLAKYESATPAPIKKVVPPKPVSLAMRIEDALRAEPLTTDDLVELLEAPKAQVAAALKAAFDAKHIYDLGSPGGDSLWTWVIGDKTETAELQAKVEQILLLRPMTFTELKDATGARHGRVSGCCVKLQQHRRPVLNLGNGRKAIWFLLSDAAFKQVLQTTNVK